LNVAGMALRGSDLRAAAIDLRIASVHTAVSVGPAVPQTPETRNAGLGAIDFGSVMRTEWGATWAPAAPDSVAAATAKVAVPAIARFLRTERNRPEDFVALVVSMQYESTDPPRP
jgi:hypothetical protein